MVDWEFFSSNLLHVQLLDLSLFVVFQADFPIFVLLLEQQNANKRNEREIRLTRNFDFCPPLPIEALQDRGKSSSLEDSLVALPAEFSHTWCNDVGVIKNIWATHILVHNAGVMLEYPASHS